MSNTYFTSLSGMLAASMGLQNTSHNVANMQNPGFKRTDLFYTALGGSSTSAPGGGVAINGQRLNFNAGKYLETGNATDLAIVGNGFFVIRLPDNELRYSRGGQFSFNKEGFLYDSNSQGLVQGYDDQHHLLPIRQSGPKTCAGKATEYVELKGNLVSIATDDAKDPNPDPNKSNYEKIEFKVAKVFDEQGIEHQLVIELETRGDSFNKLDEDKKWWIKNIRCSSATILFDPESSIEFDSNSNGDAISGNNSFSILLNGKQRIKFDFGDRTKGSDYAVHLNKKSAIYSNTEIQINAQDGYGAGKQIGFHIDENGKIIYQYDNGQTQTGLSLALAHFLTPDIDLVQADNNLYRATSLDHCRLGTANKESLGSIQANQLESANVDSTIEFANIVVLQRMFQACSQIMEIDKQLFEDFAKK